jgi:hypothetical protein
MLVHCDTEDPICNQHDDELPDDDPFLDPPENRPVFCTIGAYCYDEACQHYQECRWERH